MMHIDFFNWAEEWEWNGNMSESLRKFSDKLKAWNNNTFGNVFKRKMRLQLCLAGVQRALASHNTNITEAREETERRDKRRWCGSRKQEWIGSNVGIVVQIFFTLLP